MLKDGTYFGIIGLSRKLKIPQTAKINRKLQSTYEIPTNLTKPENFVVLEFEINSVDLLKLEQPIHRRYLWKNNSNKWEKIEINP